MIDDFALDIMDALERRDAFEIFIERHRSGSTPEPHVALRARGGPVVAEHHRVARPRGRAPRVSSLAAAASGMKRGIVLLAAVLLGCTEPAAEPTCAERDFDERVRYMNDVVLPTMQEIFEAEDPERFAGFRCANCHGVDRPTQDYAMPAFLPALPLEGTLEAAEQCDPEMTAFMLDEVFRVMVELLDEETKRSSITRRRRRVFGTRCLLVAE